jgi:hypothetical protein
MKCLADNSEWPTLDEMHKHLRSLKIKQVDYYQKYVPRFDKLTGELIEFRNLDFYTHSFFNRRENLVSYFKQNKNKQLIVDIFRTRKEQKQLTFFPSTTECRTSIIPSPLQVKTMGFSVKEIADEVGLKLRYDYDSTLKFDEISPLEVIIDTREQNPLVLNCGSFRSKIDIGDYISKSHFNNVGFERKSLMDFCGTLSKGFERFERELVRAAELNMNLVVGIEEPLNNLLNLPFLEHTRHLKCSPEFICSRSRELCQKHEHVQFVFFNNRKEMANFVEKLFLFKGSASIIDSQFMIDSKQSVCK